MNETSFTYSGVTVQYTEAQKAIILQDQNLITQLKGQLINHQNEIQRLEGLVNEAKDHLDNECNGYSGSKRQNCINQWNAQWDTARSQQNTVYGYITVNGQQQASAVKKLNDDIATIQNDIKLQIQTQLANTAAETAAANNQTTVTTAPVNAAAAAQLAITQANNAAAAEKAKSERQTKMFGFGIVAVVIITIGFLAFRRATS